MESGPTKLLRDAVVMLSLSPEDQQRRNGPGCLTCDLSGDFELGWRLVREGQISVSEEQNRALEAIQAALNRVPDADWECFSPATVSSAAWQVVREAANAALPRFGWQGASVDPFTEVSAGGWKRP